MGRLRLSDCQNEDLAPPLPSSDFGEITEIFCISVFSSVKGMDNNTYLIGLNVLNIYVIRIQYLLV